MSLTDVNEIVADSSSTPEEISKQIKEEQAKELSYIVEAGSAADLRIKYLAKKNEYKIALDDGSKRTVRRQPLSARKNKEIEDFRTGFTNNRNVSEQNPIKIGDKEFTNRSDILFEAYVKTAEYCLGLSKNDYDSAIWEDDDILVQEDIWGIRSIVEACLLRAVHGQAHFHNPSKTS